MQLTPEIVKAAYEFLIKTPPFNRWKLPQSSDVKFLVAKSDKIYGCFNTYADSTKLEIVVSDKTVGHTDLLLATVAHEIIHLYQHIHSKCTKAEHNAHWKKLAGTVCKHHGWDVKAF